MSTVPIPSPKLPSGWRRVSSHTASRFFAASITAVLTGEAYAQSARIAGVVGPYENYPLNRSGHDRVMEMHRLHAYRIREEIVPSDLLGAELTEVRL